MASSRKQIEIQIYVYRQIVQIILIICIFPQKEMLSFGIGWTSRVDYWFVARGMKPIIFDEGWTNEYFQCFGFLDLPIG